jgi:plasmid stability protein
MPPSATPEPDAGSERTTVTLPVGLARRLRTEARSHDRSVSAIVREALQAYLAGQPAPELPSFAGVGESGIADLSVCVEELLAQAARRRSAS